MRHPSPPPELARHASWGPRLGRALLGILLTLFLLLSSSGCSKGCSEKPPAPETRAAAETRAGAAAQDPNAENPDRDRWVDLAKIPFDPKLVGGTFVQLRDQLVTSLNAVVRVNGSADVEKMHKFLLGAPLLMETPDHGSAGFQVVPYAAAGMPEESADHLTQTWTLRPDLTWEDGTPVTAEDYAFTLKMIKNADVGSALADAYGLVAAIETIDTLRFRVKWRQRHFRALEVMGLDFQVVPAHALPSDAASFAKATTHLACGPYRIAKFEPASRIELVLRDEYRTKPFPIRPYYVERFVYEGASRDQTASLTRLINGEAHLVALNGDQYATEGADPAFQRAAWRSYVTMPSYSFIVWNLHDPADLSRPHPILGDVRVRTALSHLVPLETIARTTYRGLARPVSGPFDFRDAGTDPAIAHFAHDPVKAAALLREAGWIPGADGRLAKEGSPLRLTLARGGKGFALLSQALQEEARKIGVEIAIDDRGSKFFDEIKNHQFDAAVLLWQLDAIDPDVSGQWHSRFARKDGENYPGFADADVDRLLDEQETTFDAAKRAELRRGIHRRLHEQVPATFLLANAATIGISKRFANVKVHDLGIRFHDFVLRELWENRQR